MMVRELINLGEKRLSGAGVKDAKVDAEQLFCYLMNVDKKGFFMMWSKDFDEDSCEEYFKLVDERAKRVPLQHIIGSQEFMGMEFEVSKDVLIPRQDTEILVEQALKELEKRKGSTKVLDLCSGTGAIGISISKLSTNAKVTCSDMSEAAVRLTEKNAKNLKASITVKQGDLFEPFKKAFGKTKFDMIVSNPPYIESAEILTLEPEVREHEPLSALDGGEDGLEFYKRILEEAGAYLRKSGSLILEIGYNQGKSVMDIAESLGQYEGMEIIKDYNGLDRVFFCRVTA